MSSDLLPKLIEEIDKQDAEEMEFEAELTIVLALMKPIIEKPVPDDSLASVIIDSVDLAMALEKATIPLRRYAHADMHAMDLPNFSKWSKRTLMEYTSGQILRIVDKSEVHALKSVLSLLGGLMARSLPHDDVGA
jgi:hypothetical protein